MLASSISPSSKSTSAARSRTHPGIAIAPLPVLGAFPGPFPLADVASLAGGTRIARSVAVEEAAYRRLSCRISSPSAASSDMDAPSPISLMRTSSDSETGAATARDGESEVCPGVGGTAAGVPSKSANPPPSSSSESRSEIGSLTNSARALISSKKSGVSSSGGTDLIRSPEGTCAPWKDGTGLKYCP